MLVRAFRMKLNGSRSHSSKGLLCQLKLNIPYYVLRCRWLPARKITMYVYTCIAVLLVWVVSLLRNGRNSRKKEEREERGGEERGGKLFIGYIVA